MTGLDLSRLRALAGRRAAGGLAALAVVWIVLGITTPRFLSSDNLVNVTQQSAITGMLTLGVVLVMLIGHLDISVGAVSGLGSATVAVAVVQHGVPEVLAIGLAILTGVVLGLAYGLLSTRLRLPGFVLTLAGLLVALGLQLQVLGRTGAVNLPFETSLVRFAQQAYVPTPVALGVSVLVVLGVGALGVHERRRRDRAGLAAETWVRLGVRTGLLAALLLGGTLYLSTARGVGWMFALFLGVVTVLDVCLRRTRWGRHVRAIGGSAESARRAGLGVDRTVISVYVLCSSLAAFGGVLAAGRLAAANQGTGGAELSLTAIAAALIGGVSLYGGRGSAWSAVLGVAVVQSISSGLAMLGAESSVRYLILGVVLVVAVAIDATGKREAGRGRV
ncbi:sugar ABC transporter permease [Sanguibacter sp. HDW7]|uniref:sugar ABC transporter permease n=1 Tax=Sanguibacter sp. HDW7 TaxID=2714931 RepID=UPI00140AA2D3|nr:sugar ABC transporter permease [Sanguibacter sp. HDW7]QIK82831.1 sugar ABC transporter permease [Sanguibacter sp. HDW7]